MADERRLDIKVRMSSEELSNQIKQTRNELGGLQSAVKRTDAELKAYGKSTETLENKQDALQKTISKQEDQMESLSIAYERSVKATGEASKESIYLQKQMNNLGTSLAKNKGELAQVQSELVQLGGSAKGAGSDVNSLESDMKSADASIANYKSEVKKAGAELKLFGSNSETTGNKIKALEGLYSAQEKKMESLNRAYKDQVNHSGKASNAAQELKAKMNNLAAEMADVQSEIKQTANSMGELEDAGSGGGEAGPFTGVVKGAKALVAMEIADKIAEIGDKIKEFAATTLESFDQVEGSQQKLQNAFGLTEEEAQSLQEMARGLARDGFVPSMEEATTAIQTVKSNLRDLNNEDLQKIVEQAIALEETFGMDMDETMRGTNALMTTFGVSAQDAMDKITVGAQNGMDKSHELGDNLAEYSTLFKQNGYSADEMFAILQAGLDGGAYNLDKVNDLVKEFGVRMTDGTVKDALTGMGGDWENLQKQIEDGNLSAKDAFQLIGNEINGLSSETEKAAAIQKIFGTMGEDAGVQVMTAMFDANGAIKENEEAFKNASGAASGLSENSVTEVEKLKGALQDLKTGLAPIGEAIAKAIMPFVEGLTSLGDKFTKLSPDIQNIIVQVGIFAAAFATVLPVIITIVAAIGLMGTAAAGLGIGLAPLIGIIFGIAAAIAGIIAIIMNWGTITDWIGEKWTAFIEWLSGVWDGMKEIASSAWEGVVEAISGVWSTFTETMSGVFEGIATWFSGVWEGFKEIASTAWTAIGDVIVGILNLWFQWITLPIRLIITAIILIWEGLKAVAGAIWGAIGDTIVGIWNGLVGFAQTVWGVISTTITTIWNGLVTVAQTIWNIIVAVITTVWNTILTVTTTVWNVIKGIITTVWSVIQSVIQVAIGVVLTIVTTVWNTIKTVTTSIWNVIKTVIQTVWNVIKTVVTTGINLVKSVITAGWNVIKSITSSVWNAIKSVISGVWNAIKGVVMPAVNVIKSIVTSAWNAIKSVTSSVWNGIKSVISRTVGTIKSVIGGIKGVISGVAGAFRGLFSTISNVMGGIVRTIQGAWNKAGKILDKLNPFSAEGEIIVREEDPNPYKPAKGHGGPVGPFPSMGGALGSVLNAVGNSVLAVQSGVNSTMGNLNSVYRNTPRVQTALATPTSQSTAFDQGDNLSGVVFEFPITIEVDDQKIARATAKATWEEIQKMQRRQRRNREGIV